MLLDVELVGLPMFWEPFVQGICAREMLPGFERIWIDCIKEETLLVSKEDTNGLSVMNMVIFLHSFHTRGEGEEGSKNHQ